MGERQLKKSINRCVKILSGYEVSILCNHVTLVFMLLCSRREVGRREEERSGERRREEKRRGEKRREEERRGENRREEDI